MDAVSMPLAPSALFAPANLAVMYYAGATHIRNPRLDGLKDPAVATTGHRSKALCGRDVFNPQARPFDRSAVSCARCIQRYDTERPQ